ncbi:hypothetical protein EZY14_007365 [Kordia sp. TARA_039_SRF]|nr:hypothetical protein EZY14_007365 [Kordia sp. TARA_039_SRF]
MAVTAKTQNGSTKKATTAKKAVQEKLAQEAVGQKTTPASKTPPKTHTKPAETPVVNLQDKLEKLEQMKGLAQQRTRLNSTLTELNKFKYNQSESVRFEIVDSQNLSFKTTNSNLITLVTNHLKATLETRKSEIEKELIAFEL